MANLTCYGGVGEVTGANFLLETEGMNVLVDCGLYQGGARGKGANRAEFEYEPSSMDLLLVTHAHMDHIGRIPLLVKDGFTGEILSTPETRNLAELMLEDARRIIERNAKEAGVLPEWGAEDMGKAFELWETIEYHKPRSFTDFTLELFDAGHILGSSMHKLTFKSGKSMVFTGDIGNSPSPLLRDTEEISGAEYMLIESVYGDRNHESKEERDRKFREVVTHIAESKGTLLIPIFALERTQVILNELDNLFESGKVSEIPVFLDSPLAIKVTDIYEQATKHYNDEVKDELAAGDEIFRFKKLKETAQVRDSREIMNVRGPKIILAGSGMSTAGRIVGHEETYLPDPNNVILFVGYQAPGTMGREIVNGASKVRINDHEVEVRAKVESVNGFSAHGDSDALLKLVGGSKDTLKQVFVAMGEPESSSSLATRLKSELGIEAVVPERGRAYKLEL